MRSPRMPSTPSGGSSAAPAQSSGYNGPGGYGPGGNQMWQNALPRYDQQPVGIPSGESPQWNSSYSGGNMQPFNFGGMMNQIQQYLGQQPRRYITDQLGPRAMSGIGGPVGGDEWIRTGQPAQQPAPVAGVDYALLGGPGGPIDPTPQFDPQGVQAIPQDQSFIYGDPNQFPNGQPQPQQSFIYGDPNQFPNGQPQQGYGPRPSQEILQQPSMQNQAPSGKRG